MIINKRVLDTPTLIVEATTTNIAIILVNLTNISNENKDVDLYVVQAGKNPPVYDVTGNLVSGDEETIFLKDTTITAKNSLLLNFEKLLLAPGDKLYAMCQGDSNALVVTISAETY